MIKILDGFRIRSENDFHRETAKELDLGPYYGSNNDALWDVMTTDVQRPLTIIWEHSDYSQKHMGRDYDRIVKILRDVEEFDKNIGWKDVFNFIVR